ncbi:DNA-directed RNA polymerase subunit delta [Domibacillus sp. A3M-37]|uniref:DNA-directed RNA polymerase subunit delta n=1 Tax=Domibacillus sp. A3M-37 TaxID=2962037 RepID=UPI0020B7BEAA|nr:DNA-directed RNA polymerase subunit delta [Domibacillus sp. A3M-37]MCP3761503.1 DNA-directed RNA polymerase subunit delta [Domibacillus sp. A3M-37]
MVSLQHSKEELKEMSFLELAHLILADKREPILFKDLLAEIKKHLEISEQEVKSRMVQFYTDLNIDGSFLSLGENRWGLRAWYPVEKLEEETTNAPVKTRKKKAKKAVVDDFEEEVLEEEEVLIDFEEEEEDFDEVEEDLDVEEEDLDEDLEDGLDVVEIDEDDEDDEDDDFEKEEGAEDEYNLGDK